MSNPMGPAMVSSGSTLIGDIFNTWQQWKNRNWMKHAQRVTWDREDNAIQRRVADLKAAGLSPTLAAGQGASSSAPVRLEPVQTEAGRVGSNMMDKLAQGLTMRKLMAEIGKTAADARAADADAKMKEAMAKYAEPIAQERTWHIGADSLRANALRIQEEKKIRQVEIASQIAEQFGLSRAAADLARTQIANVIAEYRNDFEMKSGQGYATSARGWIKMVSDILSIVSQAKYGY